MESHEAGHAERKMAAGAAMEIRHASTVAIGGRAILIEGPSGSGKSKIALGLLARGARLVADDRTCVANRRGRIVAWSPRAILGRIEARGVGILTVAPALPSTVTLRVDLAIEETDRLPPLRSCDILHCSIPLVLGRGMDNLEDILFLILSRHGELSQ